MDPITMGLLGAGISAGAGALGGLLDKPKKPKTTIFPTMDPQQRGYYGSLLDWLGSRVGKSVAEYGGGPWTPWAQQAYKRYRKVAQREFSERLLPQLREGYAGAGALYSGARHRAEGDAAVRLSELLGAKRWDYERQGFQDYLQTRPEFNPALQQLLATLQVPTFGTTVQPQGGGAGAGIGQALMGFGGEAGGGLLSSALAKWLKPRDQAASAFAGYGADVGAQAGLRFVL